MGKHWKKKEPKPLFVCAPCNKECSGENSLLQHCFSAEHFRKAGHRGFAGCVPNKHGDIPQLSEDFFARIEAGPAAFQNGKANAASTQEQLGADVCPPANANGTGGGAPVVDKYYQTLYKCAACGTSVSGHLSFVEHCRGKAHIKTTGFSGFAGLLPNEAGIIPPVPPQLLANGTANADGTPPDFAIAAAAAASAMTNGQKAAAVAPAAAPATNTPPPAKVQMDGASLQALAQAARAHDAEAKQETRMSAKQRAAEKKEKAAAARSNALHRVGGNRAGPVPTVPGGGPLADDRSKLPSAAFRETVLGSVRDNQVTVLQGDTGCGKTTQVPQFVLEEAAAAGHHVSIVRHRWS